MDDATLVAAAREGDREAFAAIYDRYADRIHDFCCSVLRDRVEAADAMQDTFLAAARKLIQLRDPSKLRAWLFAIARHESLRRAKARTRAVPTDDFPDLAAQDASPEDEVRRADLSEIVWAAAAGLSERDRVLLDLHLRQGLDGQDLGDAIGVSAGHAYVLMNRLRNQVERALGALLVARLGRNDCEKLAGILRGWDGTFSVLIRKRVARHVDGCDLCSERRKGLVSPLSLLAAVPMIPAAPALRDRVLSRIELTSATSPIETQPGKSSTTSGATPARRRFSRGNRWRRDGFPPAMIVSRAARRLAATAAASLLAAGLGGGAFLALRDADGRGPGTVAESSVTTGADVTTTARTAPTTTSPTSATSTPATSAATAVSAVTPAPTPAPTLPATTAPTTTSTTAPATTTTTTIDDPPVVEITNVGNTTIYQTSGGCTPTESYFEAIATDDDSVSGVRISWTSASGSGSAAMVADNGFWYGTVGPFADVSGDTSDTVDVTVTARDSAGQTGSVSFPVALVYEILPYC